MCLDVALGALARVDALADRGVLGRQAERVEALRMEDVHAVARAEARDDVADRVHEHVPHVQRPGGVREHLEDVALRLLTGLVRDLERLRVRPDALPLLPRSRLRRTVHRLSHSSREQKSLSRERLHGNVRGVRRARSLVYARSCSHEPKTVPGKIQRCSSSSRCPPASSTASSRSVECRASELAERFGTPLVVYCEETLRAQARALRAAAGADGRVFYGTKAFANVAVLRLLREEGIGADVASAGELAFARAAGLAGAELVVHGNNKDEALLRAAAGEGAPVVLDAADEAELAAAAGVARVLVRVTLGVDADTHEAIVTGHHGSKFGLPPERGAERSWRTRSSAASTSLGLHVHVGLAAPRLHRAGGDDPAARRRSRPVPRRARLGGARRRPRRRLRHPPPPDEDDVPEAAELAAAAVAPPRASVRGGRARGAGRLARARALARRPSRRHALPRRRGEAARRSGPGWRSTAGCPTTRVRSSTTRATRR